MEESVRMLRDQILIIIIKAIPKRGSLFLFLTVKTLTFVQDKLNNK